MVADRVEIDTLSFQQGAQAAHWESTGDGDFEITPSKRTEIGTTIVLHINEDSNELLDSATLGSIVARYCSFMKYPVFLDSKQVNDTRPLWTQSPSQLKDEDYKEFFQKVFPMSPEPLFWIHLNVDYPFNLRGILYFPRLNHELDAAQGQVKLFL